MHACMNAWLVLKHRAVHACCMHTKFPRGHKISTMHKVPSIKAKNINDCSPRSSPRWGTPTSAIRSYEADTARGKLQHSKAGDPQTKQISIRWLYAATVKVTEPCMPLLSTWQKPRCRQKVMRLRGTSFLSNYDIKASNIESTTLPEDEQWLKHA